MEPPRMNAPTVEIMLSRPHPGRLGYVPDAARHAAETEHMLHEERSVEPDYSQPEVPLAKTLVQHAAGDLGIPVIGAGEEAEERAAEKYVVNVRNDDVGVGELPVHGHHGKDGRRIDRRW